MATHLVTGLDIGTSSVRVVVCEYKPNQPIPTVLALVRKNTRGLRRGYITNIEEASQVINEALREAERVAGRRIRRVFLSIGGVTLESKINEGNVAISRGDAEVSELDINRAIEASEVSLPDLSNRYILHKIPLGYKIDNKKIYGRPEGWKGAKLEVRTLFITASNQHIKDFIRAVEDARVIIEEIVAAPLAASFSTLTKVQKAAGCILANIGSQTTSIVVFEDGIPLSIFVFPIGSTDITNDIALGFKIPLEDAERIKKGEHEPVGTRKKLDEIIEARLSDIFELIESHLKKISRNNLLPAGIVITGGGSGVGNIEDLAKNHFKLPARTATQVIASSSHNQIKDATWSVAYGLCLFGADVETEELVGISIARETKKNFVKWVKELLP